MINIARTKVLTAILIVNLIMTLLTTTIQFDTKMNIVNIIIYFALLLITTLLLQGLDVFYDQNKYGVRLTLLEKQFKHLMVNVANIPNMKTKIYGII